MLTEFNFHAPSFVVAGRNSVHQTGELLNQWGAAKISWWCAAIKPIPLGY